MSQTLIRISWICYGSAVLCFGVSIALWFAFRVREAYFELKGRADMVLHLKPKGESEAYTIAIGQEEGAHTSIMKQTVFEQFVVTRKILYVHSEERL